MASGWHRLLETARWNLSRHRASRLFCRFTPRSSLLLCFPFASTRAFFFFPRWPFSISRPVSFFPFNDLCFHENFITRRVTLTEAWEVSQSWNCMSLLNSLAFSLRRPRFNAIFCLQYSVKRPISCFDLSEIISFLSQISILTTLFFSWNSNFERVIAFDLTCWKVHLRFVEKNIFIVKYVRKFGENGNSKINYWNRW